MTTPDGTVVVQDDGIHAGTTLEKLSGLAPRSAPMARSPPAGALSAQRRCCRRGGDERREGLGPRPHASRPRGRQRRHRGLEPRDHGHPVEASRQALARAGMTIDDIDLVEIRRGVRRPGGSLRPTARHRLGQAQHPGWLDRTRPSLRHDRRPDHDHPHPQPDGVRQDLRPGDDVRGWRSGNGHDRRTAQLIAWRAAMLVPRGKPTAVALCAFRSTP